MRAVVIAIVVLLLAYYIHPLFLLGLLTLLPDQEATVNVIKKRGRNLLNPAHSSIRKEIRLNLTTDKLEIIFLYALFKAFDFPEKQVWTLPRMSTFLATDANLINYLDYIYENSGDHSLFGKSYYQTVKGFLGTAEDDVSLVFSSVLPFIDDQNLEKTISDHRRNKRETMWLSNLRPFIDNKTYKNKAIRIFNRMMAEICYVNEYHDLSNEMIKTTTQPPLWIRYVGCTHETYIMTTTTPNELGKFAYNRDLLKLCNIHDRNTMFSPEYAKSVKHMWLHFKGTQLSNILIQITPTGTDKCGLDLSDLEDLNYFWMKKSTNDQTSINTLTQNFGKHRKGLRRMCRTVGRALGRVAEASSLKKRRRTGDHFNQNVVDVTNKFIDNEFQARRKQQAADNAVLADTDRRDIVPAKDTRLNAAIWPQQIRWVSKDKADQLPDGSWKVKDNVVPPPLPIDFVPSEFTFDPDSSTQANFASTDVPFRFS